jgi:hypothetical protein
MCLSRSISLSKVHGMVRETTEKVDEPTWISPNPKTTTLDDLTSST